MSTAQVISGWNYVPTGKVIKDIKAPKNQIEFEYMDFVSKLRSNVDAQKRDVEERLQRMKTFEETSEVTRQLQHIYATPVPNRVPTKFDTRRPATWIDEVNKPKVPRKESQREFYTEEDVDSKKRFQKERDLSIAGTTGRAAGTSKFKHGDVLDGTGEWASGRTPGVLYPVFSREEFKSIQNQGLDNPMMGANVNRTSSSWRKGKKERIENRSSGLVMNTTAGPEYKFGGGGMPEPASHVLKGDDGNKTWNVTVGAGKVSSWKRPATQWGDLSSGNKEYTFDPSRSAPSYNFRKVTDAHGPRDDVVDNMNMKPDNSQAAQKKMLKRVSTAGEWRQALPSVQDANRDNIMIQKKDDMFEIENPERATNNDFHNTSAYVDSLLQKKSDRALGDDNIMNGGADGQLVFRQPAEKVNPILITDMRNEQLANNIYVKSEGKGQTTLPSTDRIEAPVKTRDDRNRYDDEAGFTLSQRGDGYEGNGMVLSSRSNTVQREYVEIDEDTFMISAQNMVKSAPVTAELEYVKDVSQPDRELIRVNGSGEVKRREFALADKNSSALDLHTYTKGTAVSTGVFERPQTAREVLMKRKIRLS
jgi:hypothetical protein